MYELLTLADKIRVLPHMFKDKLEDSIQNSIIAEYIGQFTNDNGIFISFVKINSIGEGRIIHGDGAVYYETEFDMLVYKPFMQETVKGAVTEITEFGAFVRIGPIDALVHVSQVMDDYVSFSKSGSLQGKSSNRSLNIKDTVLARVIAISLKNLQTAKIGLTMRQLGLGNIKWIEEDKKKAVQLVAKEAKAK